MIFDTRQESLLILTAKLENAIPLAPIKAIVKDEQVMPRVMFNFVVVF